MSIKRKVISIQTTQPHQGFLGAGHTARAVIQTDFAQSDPFIMLMDDMLDKKDDIPVGGPHPHAGFETVSLMIEGEIGDGTHKMKDGDFQIMTAGSGVVHTETIAKKMKMQLMQLWLNLPKEKRWIKPRLQDLSSEQAPRLSENGVEIKIYSGSFAGLQSPISNYVPLILADIKMQAGVSTKQNIPASFTAFIYVLEGSVQVDDQTINQNQVGWLDRFTENKASELNLKAAEYGTRFLLYAAQPQGSPIVSHGPFIGDSPEDISRLYREYREGRMEDILTVAAKNSLDLD
ncbi:MAG: pirin family protein [Bacteroidetes bacterium]|nr:MAG: pirin family protein [Bacteroidota bacterium]